MRFGGPERPAAHRLAIGETGRRQRDATAPDRDSSTTIARNALNLVAGQVATTALSIVLSAALGRFLGAREFGTYYLITAMCSFASVFVEWGQPYFVIRLVAREPLRAGDMLGAALALRVALAAAVMVPAGLIAWALGYGARTTSLSVLLILANLPLFLAQGYGMVFRARDQMGRDATVSVANKAIVLCVTVPALAFGAGIPGVILGQAVAGAAALGIAGWLYARLGAPSLRLSRETLRELLAGGTPLLAMTSAVYAQPYLDAIVLSKLAPGHVVGWYGAARNVLGLLMTPAAILGTATYPRLARVSGDAVALREEVRSAFRSLLWLGALAGAGTYLFAHTAIGLVYGSSAFGPAATILEVFAPGLFLVFFDILLGNIIYACGRTTGFAAAKIVSVLVGTGLDVLLIPLLQERLGNGGVGVVLAFALSELVVFGGAMIVLPRGVLQPATALDVARALGAAGATILLFRLMPPMPPWIGMPLCVAAFAAASLVLGLMGRRDLAVLQSLVLRQRGDSPGPIESDL